MHNQNKKPELVEWMATAGVSYLLAVTTFMQPTQEEQLAAFVKRWSKRTPRAGLLGEEEDTETVMPL
jgi:hypothetical protein